MAYELEQSTNLKMLSIYQTNQRKGNASQIDSDVFIKKNGAYWVKDSLYKKDVLQLFHDPKNYATIVNRVNGDQPEIIKFEEMIDAGGYIAVYSLKEHRHLLNNAVPLLAKHVITPTKQTELTFSSGAYRICSYSNAGYPLECLNLTVD